MPITEVHARLANTALYFSLILALWGLFRFYRKQGIDSSYWGALVIAEVLFLVQAVLGAYMYLSGTGVPGRPAMHILYGVVSLLVIPGVYFYTRGDEQRRAMLLYGVFLLFQAGILLRAMDTGIG